MGLRSAVWGEGGLLLVSRGTLMANIELSGAGPTRRTALRGGLVLLGAAGLGGVAAAPALADVRYSSIGYGYSRPTRYRTAYNGQLGVHPKVTAFTYNNDFFVTCANWADTYGGVLKFMTSGRVDSSWFGCAGVGGGTNPNSNHYRGNAFDCTAVYHTDGGYVDCNYSHTAGAGVVNNRKYAALAWSGRKYMPEVGIVGSEPRHSNHIHFGRYKNGSGSLLLTRTAWDARLVQYTCKAFMGVPIAVDGQWGSQTTGYYNQLMSRMGMSGRNPFGSTAHLQDLAHMITARGVVGLTI